MESWPFEAESAFDVRDLPCQELIRRLADYHKVYGREKELSALTAVWPVGRRMAYEMQGSQAMGPRHYSVVKDPRRGNGRLDTSRGRKKSAQVYMGALQECRRSGIFGRSESS